MESDSPNYSDICPESRKKSGILRKPSSAEPRSTTPSKRSSQVAPTEHTSNLNNPIEFTQININGLKYQMLESAFLNLPIYNRIVSVSVKVFDPQTRTTEYFLENDRSCFLAILDYFKHGELHLPDNVCMNVFKREIEFWNIDWQLLQTCCFLKYSAFKTGNCYYILHQCLITMSNVSQVA